MSGYHNWHPCENVDRTKSNSLTTWFIIQPYGPGFIPKKFNYSRDLPANSATNWNGHETQRCCSSHLIASASMVCLGRKNGNHPKYTGRSLKCSLQTILGDQCILDWKNGLEISYSESWAVDLLEHLSRTLSGMGVSLIQKYLKISKERKQGNNH